MGSYRLRVQLQDVPGALGALAEALGRAGCNVLRVDVHGVDGTVAVDDLSIVTPPETTATELDAIVRGAGAQLVAVGPLAVDGDLDPVTAAFDRAARVARTTDPAARTTELGHTLADQLGADHGWVLPAPRTGEPLFGREAVSAPTVIHLSTTGGRGRDLRATLALIPQDRAVGIALRWGSWTYTGSELARAQGVLRLGGALDALPDIPPGDSEAELVLARDGTFVAIRELDATDAAHILDLDLQVSERSRRSRYLASRGLPSAEDLAHLAAEPSGALALGAWSDTGMIAEARCITLEDDPTTADLAVLVADAHQRCGLGLLLVRHLAARAHERGIGRFVATVAPSNDAMRHLLRRLTPVTITRVAHGTAEVLVPLDAIGGDVAVS